MPLPPGHHTFRLAWSFYRGSASDSAASREIIISFGRKDRRVRGPELQDEATHDFHALPAPQKTESISPGCRNGQESFPAIIIENIYFHSNKRGNGRREGSFKWQRENSGAAGGKLPGESVTGKI